MTGFENIVWEVFSLSKENRIKGQEESSEME